MIKRRSSFALLLLLWIYACPTLHARQPNVVVVLTDDQGWGDLSLHGNTNLNTPHIDSLARDGAHFRQFFVCPVCSPTRAEFLTGRYHPRSGVYSTSAGGERMDLDEETVADVFRSAGYATAAFGKWHNGMQYPYHPNGRGFDHFYGFCSGHWGNYFDPLLERDGKLVQGSGFLPDDLTDAALDFMAKHRDKPFLIYLPYNTPHSPMQVPDAYWRRMKTKELAKHHRDGKEDQLHLRAALAMCENIDWNVGRLLQRLTELEIADDTIFVYFHDNGPNGVRWNGDFKGRKGSTDEGGVRSPLLIRYPAQVKPQTTIENISGAIDLLSTLRELAGITSHSKKPLDGISLAPLMTNTEKHLPWPDRLLFSHWRGKVSARSQTHRYDHRGELFDLRNDPGQRVPIQNSDMTRRMKAAVKQWRDELLPGLDNDERPFVIGHPAFQYTQLPARDAQVAGGIQRSNRYPNCSFFTNWKTVDDAISWDVEIPAAGQFAVEIYYTCPEKDVGASFQLEFGNAKLNSRVREGHDPPLRGGEQDRSPRMESYVKDFKPLSMGRIELPQGRGTLRLTATDIPGAQVMDFRLLMLRRLNAP